MQLSALLGTLTRTRESIGVVNAFVMKHASLGLGRRTVLVIVDCITRVRHAMASADIN